MHPEWNVCWDTSVIDGRVILLNGTTPIADATMRQQVNLLFMFVYFYHDVFLLKLVISVILVSLLMHK
uniref:Uncharacterized protein n=1 Tax=Wuchereria bancrofti TaxID=6293 RepID=A0A1I8ENF4_WUCBA